MSPRDIPRDWQVRALATWNERRPQDFLVVACVGAGKTGFALQWAEQRLQERSIARVVVVAPTNYLRGQWMGKATQHGIALSKYTNAHEPEAADFIGAVVTYAQLTDRWVDRHRVFCSKTPTAVIFDEIHHAGDQREWGSKLLRAFEPARFRLSMSGTAWRNDDSKIPFVRYENNRSIADFPYTYTDGLNDGIVRPVYFPNVDGRMEWWAGAATNPSVATFAEGLSDDEASRRLRTALMPNGEVMRHLITQAHNRLIDIRSEHTDAGGLVICIDRDHAAAVADVVREITGKRPALVLSDPEDINDAAERPDKEIERFAASRDEWIVAVRMVSEGVDIPRLRVLVYATNALTELQFRQSVGRVIRVVPGLEEQSASVFIPADDRLKAMAFAIATERDHHLEESEGKDRKPREGPTPGFFSPIRSSDARTVGEISGDDEISEAEITRAKSLIEMVGVRGMLPVPLAKILRAAGHRVEAEPPANATERPLQDRKQDASRRLNTLTISLSYSTGREHQFFNGLFVRVVGAKRTQWTLVQINAALGIAHRWLDEVKRLGVQRTDAEWIEEVDHAWRSVA